MLRVIITAEDVKAHPKYTDIMDCPLFHVLKRDYPNFDFRSISGDGYIVGEYLYIPPYEGKWNGDIHQEMLEGNRTEPVTLVYKVDVASEFLRKKKQLVINSDHAKIQTNGDQSNGTED